MSHVRSKGLFEKLATVRSVRGFAGEFLKQTMAGQKLFLHSEMLPRVVNISFHERTCMFSCKMCPYSEPEIRDLYRAGGEGMSFETLRRLVDSIPNDPYHSFDISAIGETLQFEPLAEYIRYMKSKRPLVNTIISTNGVLGDPEKLRALLGSGLDTIQFSLFAQNKEDHERITGTKSFERVRNNIQLTIKLKKELGRTKPFIQVFMIESKETRDKVRAFMDEWSGQVDAAFVRPVYNVGRQIEGLTPAAEEAPLPKRYPCIMPWYSTAIRSNGDVLGCYMFHWNAHDKDAYVFGNINEQSLAEIWASPVFRAFRDAHLNLDLAAYPTCASCDLWSAYTNIWEPSDGPTRFRYNRLKAADFVKAPPPFRGG